VEGRESTVYELIAEVLFSVSYLRAILGFHDFGDALHDHFAVGLVLILESEVDLADYLDYSHFLGDLDCGFDQLLVVSFFGRHAPHPEGAKVRLEHVLSNVRGLDAFAAHDLLEDLQHYLSHLLIRRFELSHKSRHYGLYILTRVATLHKRENKTHCFQERSQRFISDLVDALPERLED
jgi:hypothetical protein